MGINLLEAFNELPPPIDFVLPNMIAGTVGGLVSPGGTGKSMLALQIATQIAGGPDLLGLGNLQGGLVAYIPAEDPPVAIHHRLHALGSHLTKAQQAAVAKRLLIEPLNGRSPNLLNQRWFDDLKRIASERRLMILDTLRRFHVEDENASGPMSMLVGIMESIAAETGCSIIFLHHTSKGAALSGSGDAQQASRGSSVLVDNVRWQSYLMGMTQSESDTLNVEESKRNYFVRFGVSKANYGAPFQEVWLRRCEGGILIPAIFEQGSKKGRPRGKV